MNVDIDFETGEVQEAEINGVTLQLSGVKLNEDTRSHLQWIEEHVEFPQQDPEPPADDASPTEDDREWQDDELERFIEDTTSRKQRIFLRTLAASSEEWVPKKTVMERLTEEYDGWDGDGPSTYTVIGLLGPMRRRAPDGVDPFWVSAYRGGQRQYAIRDPYRDRVGELLVEHWGEG